MRTHTCQVISLGLRLLKAQQTVKMSLERRTRVSGIVFLRILKILMRSMARSTWIRSAESWRALSTSCPGSCFLPLRNGGMTSRVGYREPVPIWNRFQYNRYLPGPKCNADFGASFRCLSQLNTVARQILWGTCKTAPAPNVNFVLCRSRSLVFS